MTWLREAISEKTGQASSKRIISLLGAVALSFATVILSVAAVIGKDVGDALWAATTPLALLGGVNYVGGKFAEGRHASPAD